MATDSSLQIMGAWEIHHYVCYIAVAVLLAIAMRLLMAYFRALAVVRRDYPEAGPENMIYGRWLAFQEIVWSRTLMKEHADLWLPFLIGLAEFLAYPILIRLDAYVLIGGWLAIKSAGNWGGWRISRTSYNRFLVANISNVFISYWLAHLFVEKTACGLGSGVPMFRF